jgi:phosphohistidine phosphatase SixA
LQFSVSTRIYVLAFWMANILHPATSAEYWCFKAGISKLPSSPVGRSIRMGRISYGWSSAFAHRKELRMTSHTRGMHTLILWSSAAAMIWLAGTVHAQELHGEALVKALQKGGYVLVMRHASSPREVPDKQAANPDNSKPERQLDEVGRNTAIAMGKALRDLRIPIGNVLSSPTYRALETVRLAQFGAPQTFVELGDNGQSMQGGTAAQAEWLQKRVAHLPTGTNTIVVTHVPNITGAFPQLVSGLADGEALIFGPDAKGKAILVTRVKIDEWPAMRF